jgi:hypothetical protein
MQNKILKLIFGQKTTLFSPFCAGIEGDRMCISVIVVNRHMSWNGLRLGPMDTRGSRGGRTR